ncbi:hypothetical protein [Humisphaera borealis]|uniref:Uncharacterized protein n=1 Tax=Humisphaera borealis TaxID=2807512 RepID=A0A7M2WX28_9BACT|nr:hypothetical protein [Humisphaera borealis]QOV89953.1 hypothetical protein IPV69_00850 [Humisphaera borealis]
MDLDQVRGGIDAIDDQTLETHFFVDFQHRGPTAIGDFKQPLHEVSERLKDV